MDGKLSIQMLPGLLLLCLTCASYAYPVIPRLGLFMRGTEIKELDDEDLKTYFYTQTLDHFNYRPESYNTFQQRYIVNYKYWGGANTSSPIFVYLGAETSLTGIASGVGFMTDNAAHFKALLVYIEHRYYGESIPFDSKEDVYQNSSTLGYFNSAQALADYAEVIINLKANLSAQSCPVLVIGGSYGGMLASWFRLKYPHIAMGALASSAPILYFDDITPQNGYHVVVTKDFQEASQSCYKTIRESWFEMDNVAAQPNGLKNLSRIFNTCKQLNSTQVLKENLGMLYVAVAQYDNPPDYPLKRLCNIIDGLPEGSDGLSRVSTGLTVSRGDPQCNVMVENIQDIFRAWRWQTCTEIVMPIGHAANDTMFQANPFDLNEYTKHCQALFGITPRPHWITTEFGGHNITSVLKRFSSNIIFSNGLRDPYSSGGVLENISNSVVAIHTSQGAHCLDLYPATPNDPKWLVSQRKKEMKIIERWITKYNHGLITNRSGRT